jgi:small subunit ribosomal protein S1
LKGKWTVEVDKNHVNLKEDQIIEGEVTRVVEEAAFVDIGTIHDAVIPRKDLDQLDFKQLEKIQKGETMQVRVTHLPANGSNPLVSASDLADTHAASQFSEEDLWARVSETYQVGDLVRGTVKNIKKYGAFVELPSGIDGLIHISEMQPGFTPSPWDVVSSGEQVTVRIIQIEPGRQRIGLSLKNIVEE